MKKYLIFLIVFVFLLLSSNTAYAALCNDGGGGIVPCGNTKACPCEIGHVFAILGGIYNFIVYWIAAPLAILVLTIGAILLLISGGNPNLVGMGKKAIWSAIIGLVLVFCSWLIINTILKALGYSLGDWSTL